MGRHTVPLIQFQTPQLPQEEEGGGLFGSILSVGGGIVGGLVGGPPGAIAGSALGSAVGGVVEGQNVGDALIGGLNQAAGGITGGLFSGAPSEPGGAAPLPAGPGAADAFKESVGPLFEAGRVGQFQGSQFAPNPIQDAISQFSGTRRF